MEEDNTLQHDGWQGLQYFHEHQTPTRNVYASQQQLQIQPDNASQMVPMPPTQYPYSDLQYSESDIASYYDLLETVMPQYDGSLNLPNLDSQHLHTLVDATSSQQHNTYDNTDFFARSPQHSDRQQMPYQQPYVLQPWGNTQMIADTSIGVGDQHQFPMMQDSHDVNASNDFYAINEGEHRGRDQSIMNDLQPCVKPIVNEELLEVKECKRPPVSNIFTNETHYGKNYMWGRMRFYSLEPEYRIDVYETVLLSLVASYLEITVYNHRPCHMLHLAMILTEISRPDTSSRLNPGLPTYTEEFLRNIFQARGAKRMMDQAIKKAIRWSQVFKQESLKLFFFQPVKRAIENHYGYRIDDPMSLEGLATWEVVCGNIHAADSENIEIIHRLVWKPDTLAAWKQEKAAKTE